MTYRIEIDIDDYVPPKPKPPEVNKLDMRWIGSSNWRYRRAKGIYFCRATHKNVTGYWLTWLRLGDKVSHVTAHATRKDAMEYSLWQWKEALKPVRECRIKLPS